MAIERVAVAADVLLYKGDTAIFPRPHMHASPERGDGSTAVGNARSADGEVLDAILRAENASEQKDATSGLSSAFDTSDADVFNGVPELLDTAASITTGTTETNLRSIRRH